MYLLNAVYTDDLVVISALLERFGWVQGRTVFYQHTAAAGHHWQFSCRSFSSTNIKRAHCFPVSSSEIHKTKNRGKHLWTHKQRSARNDLQIHPKRSHPHGANSSISVQSESSIQYCVALYNSTFFSTTLEKTVQREISNVAITKLKKKKSWPQSQRVFSCKCFELNWIEICL